ncbi:MAG: GerAB/ArcD/ProY family transporter [Lawsonibacter sp.]|nr:GerAB/ArcD/ProY family transporter [Lawsonibacter sp.]
MTMDQDYISHTQLTALIWVGVLAPVAGLFPSLTLPEAGKGAWLAPVAAIPLVLMSGWLLNRLSEEQGLALSIRARLGPVFGTLILLIYMVWGEVLLSLQLQLSARRLLSSGYRDGKLWFFLLAIAAMVLWIGVGKLSAFARAGQIFLAILLTTGAVVLLLSMFQVKPARVLPLWKEDVIPVLRSALPAAGVLGWGIYGAFFLGQVKPEKNRGRWYGIFWGVGGCLLLALSQWIILGNLGPALAARLNNPFFALAKSVGVKGAFQRVESVIASLWTLADLTMASILLLALRTMTKAIAPKVKEWMAAAVGLGLATALAMTLFSSPSVEIWNRTLVPWVNIILGLGMPCLLTAYITFIKNSKGEGTSCGKNPS